MHLMIVGIIMVQRILWKGGLDMKFGPIEITFPKYPLHHYDTLERWFRYEIWTD